MSRKLITLSLAVSIFAVLISAATLYITLLRPISLDMAVSRSAYISNTYGGIPDVYMEVSLWANGPTTKAVGVGSLKMTLTNEATGASHELVDQPDDEGFPTMIRGGEVAAYRVLAIVDDYVTDEIERNDQWCDELAAIFPEGRNRLSESGRT